MLWISSPPDPRKPAMSNPKRVHLATEKGGRSRCRYTSRPSVRAVFVPLAEFQTKPLELRCSECQTQALALAASPQPN